MSQPRNVTPGMESSHTGRDSTGRSSSGDWGDLWSGRMGGGGVAAGGRGVPWIGVLLVVVGGVLLLQQWFPGLRVSTILISALGIAFAVAWALNRSNFLLTPALVFLGLGAGLLVADLGYVRGSVWPLTLGVALLALWAIGRSTQRPRGWALWLGGLLTIIGVIQLSGQIPGLPDVSNLWPLLLIVAGAVIVFGGRFGQGRREV